MRKPLVFILLFLCFFVSLSSFGKEKDNIYTVRKISRGLPQGKYFYLARPIRNIFSNKSKTKFDATHEFSNEVYFFYSTHCKYCLYIRNEIIPKIENRYKSNIKIIFLDTARQQNLKKLLSLVSAYKRKGAYVPTIWANGELLVGKKEIEQNIFSILDSLAFGEKKVSLPEEGKGGVISYFKKFSLLGIIGAGLLDGINPCAFTVIVFFISFLVVYGYKKREIVVIGSGYIFAIFLSYILIGLGIFKFIYDRKEFYYFMKLFYLLIAIMCFILAVLALYDCLRYRKTKDTSIQILQLPSRLKQIIRKVIGKEYRAKHIKKNFFALLVGAFLVGVIVSLLEAVCTGQIYLPVITMVTKISHLRLQALFYLLVYNLMFIFPLVVIFVLSLWGVSSQTFANFLKKRLALIRFLMFLLFLGLGIIMIYNI